MSFWTHVAGIIRVDSMRAFEDENPISYEDHVKAFEKILGKHYSFRDTWLDNFNKEEIPRGSEGSLNWSLWVNPEVNAVPAYTISIFGDLRDYTDVDAIKAWFKKACLKLDVRQAVITIDAFGSASEVYIYEEPELRKLEHHKLVKNIKNKFRVRDLAPNVEYETKHGKITFKVYYGVMLPNICIVACYIDGEPAYENEWMLTLKWVNDYLKTGNRSWFK